MEPLYEVTVDGGDPAVATASALMEAWGENAPEGVARALDLSAGSQITIIEMPRVEVRRLR